MKDKNPLDQRICDKIGLNTGSLSRRALSQYQLEKLKAIVDYVQRRSPFYARHLRGCQKEDFQCLKDLAKLPFTTPDHIREHGLQMLCVSQSEIERVVTMESSGTTGKPKRVFFTRGDQELTVDFFMQGMSLLTTPKECVFILLPGERPGSIGDLLAKALARMGITAIKHGLVQSIPDTLAKMAEARADVAVGIPVQVLALARYYEKTGGKIPLSLKRVLLSTDYVPQCVVRELYRIWGVETFNYFGMSEMGLGGGIECRQHDGFHLYEADILAEIIDPDTGESLPEGQPGEVVFTTLTRKGMPLIRYRTGDLSRIFPADCPCGSITRRLEKIKARKTGLFALTAGGNLSIADLDEVLLGLPGIVDFQAFLSQRQETARLEIVLDTLEAAWDVQGIRNELLRLPFICSAIEEQSLELSVRVLAQGNDYVPRVGKRKIIIKE